MTYRTRQEIFDVAYTGFKSQGFKRSMDEDGRCLYRNGSRRCAIGWLIPDDLYTADLEGISASEPAIMKLARTRPADAGFVERFQAMHDNLSSPKALQVKLLDFARDYGLSIPGEAA